MSETSPARPLAPAAEKTPRKKKVCTSTGAATRKASEPLVPELIAKGVVTSTGHSNMSLVILKKVTKVATKSKKATGSATPKKRAKKTVKKKTKNAEKLAGAAGTKKVTKNLKKVKAAQTQEGG